MAVRVDHGSWRDFETCRQTLVALVEGWERLSLTLVSPAAVPHPHDVDNDRLPRLWAHRRAAGRNADPTVVEDAGPDWHGLTSELIRFFNLVG